MENNIFREHVPALSSRQLDQSLNHIVGTGNNADSLFFASRLQNYNRIDFLISEERERLPFSNNRRRTQRQNFIIKILFQILFLIRFCSSKINQSDSISCDLLHQILIGSVFSLVQPFHLF